MKCYRKKVKLHHLPRIQWFKIVCDGWWVWCECTSVTSYVRDRVQCAVNIQSAELESKVEHAMWQQKCFSGGGEQLVRKLIYSRRPKRIVNCFMIYCAKSHSSNNEQPPPEPHKKNARSNNLFSSESFVVWASTFWSLDVNGYLIACGCCSNHSINLRELRTKILSANLAQNIQWTVIALRSIFINKMLDAIDWLNRVNAELITPPSKYK